MRFQNTILTVTSSVLLLSACAKGPNPLDPYESINRKTHTFNLAFDAIILKPPAQVYVTVVPPIVRKGVNNFFNNIYMVTTVANDILQGEARYAIKDSWRFFINSTFGLGGIVDIAASNFNLPPHYNDLGLTFAKWGDKNSPYLVLPFIGPSTIRDAMGLGVEYVVFSPYPYLTGNRDSLLYTLIALRAIDLRSQFFETEKLMREALDNYTFMRDAWLQHRQYLIAGGSGGEDAVKVESGDFSDYVDE